MSNVIPFSSQRRKHMPARDCGCDPVRSWTCYPHRLIDLAARVEDVAKDVEQFRFCDYSTFQRLTSDVLEVIESITGDVPAEFDERTTR